MCPNLFAPTTEWQSNLQNLDDLIRDTLDKTLHLKEFLYRSMLLNPLRASINNSFGFALASWAFFFRMLDEEYADFFLDFTKEYEFSEDLLIMLSNPSILTALPERLDSLLKLYPELKGTTVEEGLKK